MDANPLPLADNPSENKFYVKIGTPKIANFTYQVSLPQGLTCSQCVVQWTYTTGNTWGKCDNGTEAIGCGPQETFRNCADIQIFSNAPTGFVPNGIDSPYVPYAPPSAIYVLKRTRNGQALRIPFIVRHQVCVPTEAYKNVTSMPEWCQTNCLRYPPNCPAEKCFCPTTCKAVGRLAGVEGTDVYCHRNCLRYPSNCPEDECKCTAGEQENDNTSGQDNEELESTLVEGSTAESDQEDILSNERSIYKGYQGHFTEVEENIFKL